MSLDTLSTVYSYWLTSSPPKLCLLVSLLQIRFVNVRFEVMLMLLKIITEVQVVC